MDYGHLNAVDVTQLLQDLRSGKPGAEARLYEEVYPELKKVASRQMRRERTGHPLQTTALVHEAYLKMVRQTNVEWRDRVHFFAVASHWMRRILVDHARTRLSQQRNAEFVGGDLAVAPERPEEIVALDEALERLERFDERQSKIVVMWFFGGMSQDEIASVLDLSTRTVKREWRLARNWLLGELQNNKS